MPRVDMSAKAVTARLKLVSELRELCLLLGTAKIESQPPAKPRQARKRKLHRRKNSK
jgi:hypothetical protein